MDTSARLYQLIPRLKAVAAKRGSMALGLWGEAGVGKSHTAAAALEGLGCRTFRVQAASPLHLFAAQLPRPRRLPSWAEASMRQLGRGETLEPTRLLDTLSALLAALAPLVVLLEDLHEAEPLRLELWGKLAETTRHSKGIALLATSRTTPPAPFEAQRLSGFGHEATRDLLEREAGAAIPEAAVRWIYARAQGNPLFTLEYFRYLARMGLLWNDTRRWHWRAPPEGLIPQTLEALIETLFLRSETGAVRALLEAAAFLPQGAALEHICEVAGVVPGDTETLRAAEHSELFSRGAFVHPLFREVLGQTLTPGRRRELARRALTVFAGDGQTLAGFIGDAELEGGRALALLEQAAEAAHEAGQTYTAARLWAQAVPYAEGEAQVRLVLRAADVLQRFDLTRAAQLCEGVLGSPFLSREVAELYTRLLAQQGRMAEVEAFLGALSERLRAELDPLALLVSRYHLAGDNPKVLALWEAWPVDRSEPPLEVLHAVAGSALALGQMGLAQALVERGLRAVPGPLKVTFLSLKSLMLYHQGLAAEAVAVNGELLALPDLLDNPRARSTALVNRAAFLKNLGNFTEMGMCLEEALEIRRTSGDARAYAFAQAALAELYLEQGRYAAAEDLLSEALEALSRYGPSRFLTNSHAIASLFYTAQATPMSRLLALKHGEQALRFAREIGSPRLVRESLFEVSVANTHAGTPRRGLELAEEAEALAEAAGDSLQDACRTAWARALAQEALEARGEALGSFRVALELARKLDLGLEAQKLALEVDRLTGDREGARARLEWFQARGLGHGVDLAMRAFPDLAERLPESVPVRAEVEAVRLEVLGPMRLLRGGVAQPIQGRRRCDLLTLLLEARLSGHEAASPLELVDAIYPEDPESVALGALKQLVFQTRKALGDGVIVRSAGGYALGPIGSDAELFLATRDTALWRGPYRGTQERSSDAALQDALCDALRQESERRLEGDPQEAARLGRILLTTDPCDLSALRLCVQALSSDPRSCEALYSQSRRELAEVGEALPETWPEFLASPM